MEVSIFGDLFPKGSTVRRSVPCLIIYMYERGTVIHPSCGRPNVASFYGIDLVSRGECGIAGSSSEISKSLIRPPMD